MSDRVPAIAWEAEPLWLTAADVARLYAISERAALRGHGVPPPSRTHPKRWSRAVLQRHWEGESSTLMAYRARNGRRTA